MKLIIYLILLFSNTVCYIPYSINGADFYIIFGSCFHSKIVDIKIGDQFDIKNINLESDFATGIVLDKNIAYNGRYLRFIVNNEERYRSPYKVINNKFAIECKDSVGIAKFDINLANGKYIFIENCGIAGSLEVKQYKKRPILE